MLLISRPHRIETAFRRHNVGKQHIADVTLPRATVRHVGLLAVDLIVGEQPANQRPVNGVTVCLFVTNTSCAKADGPIEMQ